MSAATPAILRLLLLATLLSAGSVSPAAAGKNVWTSNGPEGGRIKVLAIDPMTPTTLYAATDGNGVFQSTNGGGNWTAVDTGLPTAASIDALVIAATTPTALYAAPASGGVFKSTNGGASWSAVNTGLPSSPFDPLSYPRVKALAIDPTSPTTLYAADTAGDVFKSTNGAQSWSPVSTAGLPLSRTIEVLAIDPTTPATLYAAGSFAVPSFPFLVDGIYKSTNGGGWEPKTTGLPHVSVQALAIDPTTPTTLYAGTSGSGPFKSVNGGDSWSAANTDLGSSIVNALIIDPTAPTTLYAGTHHGGVFKSTNGGASWGGINTGLTANRVLALAIHPLTPATLYAATAPGGVFASSNGGESWSAINTGLINTLVEALAIDPVTPTTLYAGMGYALFGEEAGGGVFKSINGGGNWSAVSTGLTNTQVSALVIDPANPATLYAGAIAFLPGVNKVFKSTNSGEEWKVADTDLPFRAIVNTLAIDPMTTTTLYVGTSCDECDTGGGGAFKSINGGDSWILVDIDSTADIVSALAIDPMTPTTLYAGTSFAGVFKSIDGGQSWFPVNTGLPSSAIVSALAIDPMTPTTLYAGANGGVFKSINGGDTWTLPDIPPTPGLVNAFAIDPTIQTTLYAGTIRGVFKSTDGGSRWTPMNSGLTNTLVRALAIDPVTPAVLYAGTEGGGVFQFTAVSEPQIAVNPSSMIFDPVLVGTVSSLQSVTVKNAGTASLNLGSVTLGGTDPTQFKKPAAKDLCSGQTLAPTQTCTVAVRFKPRNGGAQGATLMILSDDPDASVLEVALDGTGDGPEVAVTPSSIDFGPVPIGGVSSLQKVTVKNDGTANLNLGSVTLGGTNPTQFRKPVAKDLCSGRTLGPTQTCTVGVRFKPKDGGTQSATLTIPSNDFNEASATVSLSGTGL